MLRSRAPGLAHWLAPLALVSLSVGAADAVPEGQLPDTLAAESFSVELRIDPREDRFDGRSEVIGVLKQATDTLWLHGREQDIARAVLIPASGETLPLKVSEAHVSGVLRLTAPTEISPGPVTVRLDYSAPFNRQLEGAYKVVQGGESYVMTQMEPLGARLAFPGIDEPAFKRPWDITLIVPGDMAAIANTTQIEETLLPDGFKRVRFARTENLPSYLIAFAVGPWDVVEWTDIPANEIRSTPLKLRGIATKGRGVHLDYALEHTGAIVAALERYFGTPYPFDKLDILAAPDFSAGAMENAGLITYRDQLLFISEASSTVWRQAYWNVHAHELAHQWFGNLVTMPWWDDLWLNEAFATWMATRVVDELRPEFNAPRSRQDAAVVAMQGDSLASTRRVRQPIHDFTEIAAAFDGITYRKGGAVLSMFEHFIGAEPFRDGIRAYLNQNARGNATSADLISAVAARSNDPDGVAEAFAGFVDRPGVPFLNLALSCDADRPSLDIRQQRYLPVGSEAVAGEQWIIPLCVRMGFGETSRSQCALVSGAATTLALDAERCPDWLMPNADGAGYYRFALAPADQVRLDAAFDRLNEAEQRVIADSLDAAFRANQIDAETVLSALPRLAQAPARQTVLAIQSLLSWLHEHGSRDEAAQAALRQSVAGTFRPRLDALGYDNRDSDSDDDRLLRTGLTGLLADFARDPELSERLAAEGRAVIAPGGGVLRPSAAPADRIDLALRMAAATGDAATFDAMAEGFRASFDPVVRGQLLAALGRFTDPVLAERAHALSLEDTTRSNEMTIVLRTQLEYPQTRDAARRWLRDSYDALMAKGARGLGGGFVALDAIGRCTIAEAEDVEAWHGPRLREVEGGPRRVAQAVEGIRLCAALKAAQAARSAGTTTNAMLMN